MPKKQKDNQALQPHYRLYNDDLKLSFDFQSRDEMYEKLDGLLKRFKVGFYFRDFFGFKKQTF